MDEEGGEERGEGVEGEEREEMKGKVRGELGREGKENVRRYDMRGRMRRNEKEEEWREGEELQSWWLQ